MGDLRYFNGFLPVTVPYYLVLHPSLQLVRELRIPDRLHNILVINVI